MVVEDYKGVIKVLNNVLVCGIEDVGKVYFSLMEVNFYVGNFK